MLWIAASEKLHATLGASHAMVQNHMGYRRYRKIQKDTIFLKRYRKIQVFDVFHYFWIVPRIFINHPGVFNRNFGPSGKITTIRQILTTTR